MDNERSKRKLADLTEALRQQREIDAQIERARALGHDPAAQHSTQQGEQQPESRLQLDKRGQDGEVLQLSFGKPGDSSEQEKGSVATGDEAAGTSSGGARIRPFDSLNGASSSAGEGRGTAADTGGVFQGPAKKKSKVSNSRG